MSDVPVLPIGVLPDMPLPIVELPMSEAEGEGMALVGDVSAGGVEGVVAAGLMPVAGGVLLEVDGELVVEPVSSTFLPQAPRARTADRATAVRTAGLKLENCMGCPCRFKFQIRFKTALAVSIDA